MVSHGKEKEVVSQGEKDYGKFTYAGKGAGNFEKSNAAQVPKGRKVKEEK